MTGTDSPPGPGRGHRKRRPPADLAARLANGDSYEAIGQAIGVGRDTVARWSQLPEIVHEVQRIQREAGDAARRQLTALQSTALSGLRGVLTTGRCDKCGRPGADPGAVVRAADSILDRTGLPKRREVEVSGGLTLEDDPAALERDILLEAAEIATERGRPELAAQLRELAG